MAWGDWFVSHHFSVLATALSSRMRTPQGRLSPAREHKTATLFLTGAISLFSYRQVFRLPLLEVLAGQVTGDFIALNRLVNISCAVVAWLIRFNPLQC